MRKMVSLLLITMMSVSLLAACAKKEKAEETKTSAVPEVSAASAENATKKDATISHLTWRVPDTGKGYDVFTNKYQGEHPNITIDVKNIASDQYDSTLKTRLLSGDPPDIITMPPGTNYTEAARQGYLLDLTDDPMLKNVQLSALEGAKVDGKVYGIPYDLVSLVVLYNKTIFMDNSLSIPTNYDEFIKVCEALKAKGITPISYGIKDSYVTQFLPYMIAPVAVYAKNTNWDKDLLEGKVKFNSAEWKRALDIPFELKDKGFLTPNALGVGDQQSVEMFAKGEAAMTLTGTWATTPARAANPELDLGIFPFPANHADEEGWINLSVGQIMSISKTSKVMDEDKAYLTAWTDLTYAQLWTDEAKTMSSIKDVSSNGDSAINDFAPYLAKMKSWQFANIGWPAGVDIVFKKKFQEVFAGKGTVEDILKAMDEVVQEGLK